MGSQDAVQPVRLTGTGIGGRFRTTIPAKAHRAVFPECRTSSMMPTMRGEVSLLLGLLWIGGGCPSAPPSLDDAPPVDEAGATTFGVGATSSSTGSGSTAASMMSSSAESSQGMLASTGEFSDVASGTGCGTEPCTEGHDTSTETIGVGSGSGETDRTPVTEPQWTLTLDYGEATASMGGPDAVNGAHTFADLCPFDEILVGVEIWTQAEANAGTRPRAPMGMSGLCAKAVREGASTLSLVYRDPLQRRGIGYPEDVLETSRCPEGHAVIGFEGLTGAFIHDETENVIYVEAVALHCAALELGDDDRVVLGTQTTLPLVGRQTHASPTAFGPEMCAQGQLARGVVLGAGAWVDSFGLWCATPSSAVVETEACLVFAGEERPCDCATLGDHRYVFCPPSMGDVASAEEVCTAEGLALLRVDDAAENGWILTTATALGHEVVALGASDSATEGEWSWSDGTIFWNGAAVEGLYQAWSEAQPDNASPGEHCAIILPDSRWNDLDCNTSVPFVCEG